MASRYYCSNCNGRFHSESTLRGPRTCPSCGAALLPDVGAFFADQQRTQANLGAQNRQAAASMSAARATNAATAAGIKRQIAEITQKWLEKHAAFVERDRDPETGALGEATRKRLERYLEMVNGPMMDLYRRLR